MIKSTDSFKVVTHVSLCGREDVDSVTPESSLASLSLLPICLSSDFRCLKMLNVGILSFFCVCLACGFLNGKVSRIKSRIH